jgi:hypothetical protein
MYLPSSLITRPVRVMSIRFVLLCLALPSGLIPAQQPPVPPAEAASSAKPVAPPLPGQLQAAPAASPSRIPDLPPAATPVPTTPLTSNKALPSTSHSGQFIVHGNDLPVRSAFSSRCEEIHEELRKLIKDQQPWVLPIVVLLNSGEAARKAEKTVLMTLSQIEQAGFHLQVTVNLRPDLRPADFRAELIRTLLHERILRQQSKIPESRTSLLPDWVFTGVMEALDYRKQVRPSALFAAIFKSGRIFGIEEIIEASPTQMDALSKSIYQTSCCALVLALLDQPEGGARLNRFLASLATDARPERVLLDQAFPSFATSPASLNKWWALQLASLSRPTASEPLSPQETVKALEDALTFRYQAKASEIPRPRPVVARITPPPATVKAAAPRIAENSVPTVTEVNPEETDPSDEKKRSLFSRLNPFTRRKSASDEAVIEAAIEDAAREEAKSREEEEAKAREVDIAAAAPVELPAPPEAEKAKIPAADERKPFFNRWFGGGKPDSAEKSESKPVASSQKPEESASMPEPEKEPAEKKPSALNPKNWFRRDKSPEPADPAPPVPESEVEKDSDSSNPEPGGTARMNLDRWLPEAGLPLVAFIYQEAAAEDAPKKKKKIFGIFGGDAKPEKKAEPAAEPKAAEAPKAEESKSKSEGKPQMTATSDSPKEKAAAKPQPSPPAEPEKPKPAAEEKVEAPEMAPTPKPEDKSPPKVEKARREPLRLKSLFGSGKKNEEENKPDEPMPKTDEAPPADAAKAMSEEKAETAKTTPPETKPTEEKKTVSAKGAGEQKPAPPKPAPEEKPRQTETAKNQEPPMTRPAEQKVQLEPTTKPATKPQNPPDEPLMAAAVPIEDYAAILKRPDRQEILQRSLLALNALQQRSAVLFRPIVAEYVTIVAAISEGKAKNVDERLKKLRQQIQVALDQSKAIRDQLDLHEANSLPAMSGTFNDYLKLPETIKKEIPPRQDAISKYLDALDREFSRP